ncbi:MAG: MFS transporter, partial [Bacteroidales bacterium]|nr:MFS transporter [Bacteroidales bacterium]
AAFLFMWTYTNGAIAQNVWHSTQAASAGYQEAANWVGVLFAVQAVGSLFWAVMIPRFKSHRVSYIVSLVVGAAGFISVFFIHDKFLLFGSYFLVGFAWSAMLALPFTILTNSLKGSVHMGEYLGLFNCTICLPQILAAALGGPILGLLGGSQPAMLVMAGIFLILGALSVLTIKEPVE